MTAVRMWARADVRARWRSWVLLGLLAGATAGLVAAGVAGARRTADAVPAAAAAAHTPDAALLANDPSFDAADRAAVAALPEVAGAYPFLVGFGVVVLDPPGLGDETGVLFPAAARTGPRMVGALVEGRVPDPQRADEVVVDENVREKYGLDLGSTMVVGQTNASLRPLPPDLVPPGVDREFRQPLRVVGIAKSVSSELSWTPSSGFYAKYSDRMPGVVNMMIDLRHGDADLGRLREDVDRIAGRPVNVEDAAELFGIRKALNVTDLERDGLLLFALAALLGGGVLVGQALVRAVMAGAADLTTWRAMGADRRMAVSALVLPTTITAVVGAAAAAVVALALSPRFPIGVARQYDLDVGVHADGPVLGVAMLATVVAVLGAAALAAWWRVSLGEWGSSAPSKAGDWAARMGWSPALVIGSRLAVEPGRGRRAVPVRSALVGAVVGVLGVVACFTFRAGIDDAVSTPKRAGVVWDFAFAGADGPIPDSTVTAIADDADVAAVLHAPWHRAVPINGSSVPVFAATAVKGEVPLVVLRGRLPARDDEVALAPTTMRDLGVAIGDRVSTGGGDDALTRVVGKVLLPATSHTDYDQSGLMTEHGVTRALGDIGDDPEDYLFVRWVPGTDVAAARQRVIELGGPDLFTEVARLPATVSDLGRLDALPVALGVFFGLLACATVAHALVTTARRRRHDFAVLRSIGFTRRQSRVAIAWQATALAVAGLVIGVPLGIIGGRAAWRWLADDFPIVYVAPLALLSILLVVPIALAVANVLAAGPALAVARIRPAETLRTE